MNAATSRNVDAATVASFGDEWSRYDQSGLGEAESRQPRFSSLALAKWSDAAQRTLICPRCGITELADKF